MTLHWIDAVAGVAYVCVRDRLTRFEEFLNAIESLIRHPKWRPGMPIVEDLREWRGRPPDNWVEDRHVYMAGRRRFLEGCRWAVVRRVDDRTLADMIEQRGYTGPGREVCGNRLDLHPRSSAADLVRRLFQTGFVAAGQHDGHAPLRKAGGKPSTQPR